MVDKSDYKFSVKWFTFSTVCVDKMCILLIVV